MLEMSVPKVECVGIADNYGRFKIATLETGYGLTLGNALRRILLSSLEGAAVTSVRIDGASHEFSSLGGVKEDVTDIVLNIKRLRMRSFSERPVSLRLDVTGPRKVLASDIKPNSEVDIVTEDLPVATLDGPDASLQMELTVERGRGYVPAEAQEDLPIGRIAVDAIYTPVSKVNYVVERTRIGQKTDYDQLLIEVWTDGTIAPGEALSQAASILVAQSQSIAAYAQGESEAGDGVQPGVLISVEADSRTLDELGLPQRTLNCLKRAHLTTVGQVLAKNKRDMLSIRNFGEKSLSELQERLMALGYFPDTLPEGFLENAEDNVPIGVLAQEMVRPAGDDVLVGGIASDGLGDDELLAGVTDSDREEEYAE